jgi:hypothetical protein
VLCLAALLSKFSLGQQSRVLGCEYAWQYSRTRAPSHRALCSRRATGASHAFRCTFISFSFLSTQRHGCADASSFLAQRRDALVHALRLSHSPHAPLKRLAAVNIAKFFKAFPDIEEDAINAIYDLCEDQDQNVSRHAPRPILLNRLALTLLFFRSGFKVTRPSFRCPRNSQGGWRGTWTSSCSCYRAVSPHPVKRTGPF